MEEKNVRVETVEIAEVIPAVAKTKLPLTHRTAAKVTAFFLAVIMGLLSAGSVLAGLAMLHMEVYTTPQEVFLKGHFRNQVRNDSSLLLQYIMEGDEKAAEEYLEGRNIAYFMVKTKETGIAVWSWQNEELPVDGFQFDGLTGWHAWSENERINNQLGSNTEAMTTRVVLPAEPVFEDDYFLLWHMADFSYTMRYWIWAIAAAAILTTAVCAVFLLCASGRRAGKEEPQPGWATKIPVDLLTVAVGSAVFGLAALIVEAGYFYNWWERISVIAAAAAGIWILMLGWCMSIALRIKLGGWWRNSVFWVALCLCWKLLKLLGRGLCGFGRGMAGLIGGIPLVWKTVLGFCVITGIEMVCFALFIDMWGGEGIIPFWCMERVALFVLVILLALMLRRLKKSGEALAAGDLSYQVDTHRMLPELRRHGENLNRIAEGMSMAVEQRMKSERMKTELITNVSHDIKTPLTSVINYADLIEKEPCDNPKITEYAEVLHRQSERLKRLIEDLVEASKASTGNLEVQLAPCVVGVLLTQTVGEYTQRLETCQLELVTSQPEKTVRVMADGRRLWRVFDNLMNNVCKYAQPGTRVYLTLEEIGGEAVISFKNTSREALNLTADELMERFVRGDSARKTEGNGLGLSIAKSLMELQNGSMELTVDGDLFKAVLRLPVIP